MDNTIKKYLSDILLAIEEIEDFLGDEPIVVNRLPRLKHEVEELLEQKIPYLWNLTL